MRLDEEGSPTCHGGGALVEQVEEGCPPQLPGSCLTGQRRHQLQRGQRLLAVVPQHLQLQEYVIPHK